MRQPRQDSNKSRWRRILRIYRIFYPHLQRHRFQILLAGLGLVGSVLMGLLKPWPLKLIIDSILLSKPMPVGTRGLQFLVGNNQALLLAFFSFGIVLIICLESLLTYLNRYLLAAVGHEVTNDIRQDVFSRLQSLSLSSAGFSGTGDLIVRLTSDIKSLRELLVDYLQKSGGYLLTFFSTVTVMIWMDWRLTLLALSVVPPLYWMSQHFSRQIQAAVQQKRRKESDVACLVQETVTAKRVVQAFAQEDLESTRFAKESNESLEASLRSVRLARTFSRLVKILSSTGTALVVWYGAYRVLGGKGTPGELVVFVAYVNDLYAPVCSLSDLAIQMIESLVSGERIVDVVEAESNVKDLPDAVEAPVFAGQVSFERVTFGYEPRNPVLKDLSFMATPGQVVALVGSSGTGKTTLANLLLRFFDPWQGRVLVDGQDIRRFTLKSLRRQISLVPQQPILFRRPVRENIAYGKPEASFEEIVLAAKGAQAHEFIVGLPEGYDMVLGEGGTNLSGGQAQRIALARAFLRNTPFLVLDEPVNSLDGLTEAQLGETLERLLRGRTTFIIAHRLSTIKRADLILLIEEGRIIEQGTHAELLAYSGVYRQLYDLQFAQLKLANHEDGLSPRIA